jgi:hypothetical protein
LPGHDASLAGRIETRTGAQACLMIHLTSESILEAFNSFNHTQWAGINLGISGANPGARGHAATCGFGGFTDS